MSTDTDGQRVRKRFECVECGASTYLHVHPNDVSSTVRYACTGECGDVTEHEPAGQTRWFETRE